VGYQMCGINGMFSSKSINNIDQRISNMNKSIFHRGPDYGSYEIISENIALGHRRLSIIDISSRANQPMVSNTGRWTIVFNGEIYNYKQLKKEVNYDFHTTSDTEVVLAYVEEFGLDAFLKKSNGMFAIALYDKQNNSIFLARDRLGIKPLLYYFDNVSLIFSSEVKGILSSGLVDAKFNESAIDEYLGNRYVREPYTFFENIYQLEAGHWLSIDSEFNFKKIRFWDLPAKFNMDMVYNESEITKNFKDILIEAIKKRLMADVPLGTYLSGGVDSSLISAITSINSCNQINTYTIGFPELNEFEYARLVAEKYDTKHHEIVVNLSDYFNSLEEIIEFKDSPLAVPNEIPLALMSRELKKRITVVLSGEGADELLGGYGRIYRAPFDYKNHFQDKISFYDYFINEYEYIPRDLRDKYILSDKKLRNYFDEILTVQFNSWSNEESVFRFFHKYHVKGLLNRVDTTTMLTGVEARVPFLDHELIEYSYKNVPYDMKLKWKTEDLKNESLKIVSSEYSEKNDIPKYLLRKISYDYLPKEIIERKKVGFPVPLNNWIKELEVLAKKTLQNAYWLNTNMIDSLLSDSKKNFRAGQIIWMFINIELFREKYFNRKWRY
jgi:asparagine synthase (glutamine-hydrolysing)